MALVGWLRKLTCGGVAAALVGGGLGSVIHLATRQWAVQLGVVVVAAGAAFVAGVQRCPTSRGERRLRREIAAAVVDAFGESPPAGPTMLADGAVPPPDVAGQVRRDAEGGDTEAMANLGALLLESGQLSEAADWLRRAADRGHVRALVNLGVARHGAGDVAAARRCWREAAKRGNVVAMADLGTLHWTARRVWRAERWWRRAAAHGNLAAATTLAFVTVVGSPERSLRWFRLAATQGGDLTSIFNLCWILRKLGRDAEAAQWYPRAAAVADPAAMAQLCQRLTERGRGDEAAEWSRRVAAAGSTS